MFLSLPVLCLLLTTSAIYGWRLPQQQQEQQEQQSQCVTYQPHDNGTITLVENGMPGNIRNMPWIVGLVAARPEGMGMKGMKCTGAWISAEYILTGAHCVEDIMNGADEEASIGITYGANQIDLRQPMIKLPPSAATMHPEYSHEKGPGGIGDIVSKDLAIIKLEEPIEFSDTVKPICLYCGEHDFTSGQAIIAGFGATNDICHGEQLNQNTKLYWAVSELETCPTDDPQWICLNTEKDSAEPGDSGSPLVAQCPNGKFMQIGVLSTGSCEINNYEKLDGQWIESVTGVKCST